MRVFATIHDDNSHSENSQSDPVLVETGSNVTLTCHGAQKSEIDWHFNSTFLGVPKCKNVKTCNLTLRWPFARGNYTCYVNDGDNCFIKVLELKGESRVIQVRKYYRSYYYYYYYYYYYK